MRHPALAKDYVESKLTVPFGYQPKIDGVRALKEDGPMTGRSLKPPANRYAAEFFSHPAFTGMDGEMAAEHECHPALCRLTSSALSTQEGTPYLLWHAFDFVLPQTVDLPYKARYGLLVNYVNYVKQVNPEIGKHLRVVPMFLVENMDQFRYLDGLFDRLGYEGGIVRNLEAPHKASRSTIAGQELLRVKHFIEEDAWVKGIIEGEVNNNEAITNLLGHTERSSHQENKVPNGMVGSLLCWDVKTQQDIIVGAGAMSHDERRMYFENPHLIVGQLIKYKTFPKGVKDKPRFPTFASIRPISDRI